MSGEEHESTRELLVRAAGGDPEARAALVEANLGLVKFVVRRFVNSGAEYDDLYQCGCLGLLKAIDRFDPGYSVQFSTYAVPVVMGEIRRYLRDNGPVHVSRTIRDQARRVREFTDGFVQREGRSPGIGEIAEGLGLSREDVLMAANSACAVRSLSEPVNGEPELKLMDIIVGGDLGDVDSRLTLSKLLAELSTEERMLIVRRYFRSHTQTQIAREMGISQVQVSRLERRILKRMRESMDATEA